MTEPKPGHHRNHPGASARFSTAIGGSILALFAGALAYGIASKTATRLLRLKPQRADTWTWPETNCRTSSAASNGEEVDLRTQPRRLDYGNDEIGQVADAFNTAQRTAVAAVRQVEIRPAPTGCSWPSPTATSRSSASSA